MAAKTGMGQTQGKVHNADGVHEQAGVTVGQGSSSMQHYSSEGGVDGNVVPSPTQSGSPNIPGSPIMYSPQLPMEPLENHRNDVDGRIAMGQVEGWSAEPTTVPTVIAWSLGGQHVELEGSFDNWTTRHVMQKSGKDFSLVKLLPPGVYQYKFIVDGEWRYDPSLPLMYDNQGNVNNVLHVQEYIAENLDGLSNFDPPPSPVSSYTSHIPGSETFVKEPPVMPPQLQLSLLNVPPGDGANLSQEGTLPRPQHVVLNHLYCQRGSKSNKAIIIGSTNRYKSKYITTVLYRARGPGSKIQVVGANDNIDDNTTSTGIMET